MRKLFGFSFLVLCLIGCASFGAAPQPTAQVDNNAGAAVFPPYSGPKVRIAVADFQVKAAKANHAIGSGLREMLITALLNSGRFSVVERQQLDKVMQEQELATSGAADTSAGAAQRGKIKTADLLITAAVTEFEPKSSGSRGNVGAGGGSLGAALMSAFNKAHMAIDIRIVDTSTSEVLAANRIQGEATDVAGSLGGYLFVLHGGLSNYSNTPMEKAIRVCIIEAVRYISQAIPASYYKY